MPEQEKEPAQPQAPGDERTLDEVMDGLLWAGPNRGGQLRFYDGEGKPLSPEEIAKRELPADVGRQS